MKNEHSDSEDPAAAWEKTYLVLLGSTKAGGEGLESRTEENNDDATLTSSWKTISHGTPDHFSRFMVSISRSSFPLG